MSTGKTADVVRYNINVFIKLVLRRMKSLALDVAPKKTEMVLFRKGRCARDAIPSIRIGKIAIQPKPYMKYLGLIFDCKLNFKQHFIYIDEKVGKVLRGLCRSVFRSSDAELTWP